MTTDDSVRAILSTPHDRELRIERVFNASRQRVWAAMTEPQLLAQWWGRGNKLTVECLEVKRGGKWRFVEHAPDGVHGFEGRFREVSPPRRYVRTFEYDGMPGQVLIETVTLEEIETERTRVVSVSLFRSREERDRMIKAGAEEGVQQSYAALDRVLGKHVAEER